MEEKLTNYNCKKGYKCILTTAAIMLLGASTAYFFIKNNEQAQIIERQVHCIDELKATINQSNGDHNNVSYSDKLFDHNWFSFKYPFTDIENIIENSRNNGTFNYNQNSSYYYHSINTTENEYIIKIALPGFSKEDVALELSDNILKIEAKTDINSSTKKGEDNNNEDNDSKNKNIRKTSQSVRIPSNIDRDNIKATLNNGLLTIILQKADINNPKEVKTIPVN
jgi:HSP20 family protein